MELASTMQRGYHPPKKRIEVESAGISLASGLGHFGRAVGKGLKNVSGKAAPTANANGVNGNGNGAAHVHSNGNGAGHASGHVFGHGAGTRPGDVARELISALWERSVPLITDRLNGLNIACEAAVLGRLSPIMRRGAAETAHKLAGSLGMFGYPRGTDLAREIEQLLENDGVVDAGLLRELVVELRATLPL
jgi:Hpt domain